MRDDPIASALRRARTGDREALEELYERVAPAVLGYLRVQGAREAEDLASEVFVGVVRGLPGFDGDERGFRSWVFTIAHRRLQDERRRLARRREEPVAPEGLEALAGAAPGADDVASGSGSAVLERLAALTPDQRAVIALRVLADLSVVEAARILGKSEGAVKTLTRRALAALARSSWLERVP
jgi:RNA polymerase sigma-70 factor (ECF subfamily)